MKRFIDTHLLQWKQDPRRKVLLFGGPTGREDLFHQRIGENIPYYVEINFDDTSDKGVIHPLVECATNY